MTTKQAPPVEAGGRSDAEYAVLLIDDHRVFADALRLSLDMQPDLRQVVVAYSAREGLARAARGGFDAVLADLDLPDARGLDVVSELSRIAPTARVLVLTAFCRRDLAQRALRAGAVAFLGKGTTLDRILAAIRGAERTAPVVDVELDAAAQGDVGLTAREHDVLRQLGCGRDASGAAAELGISLHTTRGHIKSAMAKLGARSQLGAVVAAEQRGLITLGSQY